MIALFAYTLVEAIRKGALLFYSAVGLLILIALAFGISVSPTDPNEILIFGLPMAAKAIGDVRPLEFLLAMIEKQATGSMLLFGIFATAGLVPSFLEKGTAELFLSKPISRPILYLARSFGAAAGIIVNILCFFLGVWLILGLKLGFWHGGFLLSSLAVAFSYLAFFSFVAMAGLITRSAGVAIMLAFAYSIVSTGLEYRVQGLFRLWDNVVYHRVLDGLYYLLPQLEAMQARATTLIVAMPFNPTAPQEFSILPFLYSLGSALLLYLFGCYYFSRQDY